MALPLQDRDERSLDELTSDSFRSSCCRRCYKRLETFIRTSEYFAGLGIALTFCVCAWISHVQHGGLSLTVKLFFLAFSGLGAFCSIFISAETGLGAQWIVGLTTIPDLFLAIGGMLAGIKLVQPVFAHCFKWFFHIGSNPAIAASMFIAVDMGGNKLSKQLSTDPSTGELDVSMYYTANVLGYSLGDLVCFAIPVGLAMIRSERQRQYFMLGMVPGIISTPFGSIVTYAIWWYQKPYVNTDIAANPELNVRLEVELVRDSLACLIPCLGIGFLCLALAKFRVSWLMTLFQRFGDFLNCLIRSFFWLALVQYFGRQTALFPAWLEMQPLLAGSDGGGSMDEAGLEIAGSIGCILTGVYPFITILRERLLPLILRFGHMLGFHDPEGHGILGVLGAMTNTICLFQMFPKIHDKDEIMMASAFIVSGGYILGDFLVYASLYQPSILGTLMFGKFVGGVLGCFIAKHTVCKLELPDVFADEVVEEEALTSKSSPLPTITHDVITETVVQSLKKSVSFSAGGTLEGTHSSEPDMLRAASSVSKKRRASAPRKLLASAKPLGGSAVRAMSLKRASQMFRMDPHLEQLVMQMNEHLPTPARPHFANLLAHLDHRDIDDPAGSTDKERLAAEIETILHTLRSSGVRPSDPQDQHTGLREPLLRSAS